MSGPLLRLGIACLLCGAAAGRKQGPSQSSVVAPQGPSQSSAVAPAPAPPSGAAATSVASPSATRLRQLEVAVLLSWAKVAYESFTPAEHWLRRSIGGSRKQREVWEEYCRARDALIQKVSADDTPSVLKPAVLKRMLDDLRAEFRILYPAWGMLLFT